MAAVKVVGGDGFEVLLGEQARPRSVVLFAAGAGGDPRRHLPLLRALAVQGCSVVAPRFERLASMTPDGDELVTRARLLQLAFDEFAQPGVPAVGLGHSIGAAMLLMLAGAQAGTRDGRTVRVVPERRLARLALMAPAADFFQSPGALRSVTASIAIWAGDSDEITRPETAKLLTAALQGFVPVQLRVLAGAGHFSFMDDPPLHVKDRSMPAQLRREVVSFVAGVAKSADGV